MIRASNIQIYEKNPRTRQLQSKMMLADALQEREMQIDVAKRIKAIDNKREEEYLEQQKQKERELQVKDQQQKKDHALKLEDFRQQIK